MRVRGRIFVVRSALLAVLMDLVRVVRVVLPLLLLWLDVVVVDEIIDRDRRYRRCRLRWYLVNFVSFSASIGRAESITIPDS